MLCQQEARKWDGSNISRKVVRISGKIPKNEDCCQLLGDSSEVLWSMEPKALWAIELQCFYKMTNIAVVILSVCQGQGELLSWILDGGNIIHIQ